jgi:hypothetical protein
MTIWNKLKDELDRAGRVAEQAIDEGRVRLEMHRARQRADKAAQALGYAYHQAKKTGAEMSPDEYSRLSAELTAAEAEVTRLETLLRDILGPRAAAGEAL